MQMGNTTVMNEILQMTNKSIKEKTASDRIFGKLCIDGLTGFP